MKKHNEFGEVECVCGHEPWDHVFAKMECVIRKCRCKQFKQAYE